jgi:hypothetical protein
MNKFLLVAALLVAVASHAFAGHAEEKAASEATRQAFLAELQTYFDNPALVALKKRIGPHKIYVYENAAALIEAGPSIGVPDSMTIDFLNKMRGIYSRPRNKKIPPFLIFVQDKMIAAGSADIRQRTVAHELMHALDFEVLRVSMSTEFKAAYDKDMAWLKKFTDEETGEKERKRTADIAKIFEHYLSAPKEAWAEVGARIIFPHANKKNTASFEDIFRNTYVFVRAKLQAEGISTAPVAAKTP